MPPPTPLQRPTSTPPPPPETDAQRRERQLAYFRRLADLNMEAAEIAAARIKDAHDVGLDADTASPTLDLARATRAVTQAVASENRILRGEDPEAPRAPADDPRRTPLRQALHPLANAEPSPAARAKLRRDIDERIEEALLADPDAETPLAETLLTISDGLGLRLDPSRLPNSLLELRPAPGLAPCGGPAIATPPGPAPSADPLAFLRDARIRDPTPP